MNAGGDEKQGILFTWPYTKVSLVTVQFYATIRSYGLLVSREKKPVLFIAMYRSSLRALVAEDGLFIIAGGVLM